MLGTRSRRDQTSERNVPTHRKVYWRAWVFAAGVEAGRERESVGERHRARCPAARTLPHLSALPELAGDDSALSQRLQLRMHRGWVGLCKMRATAQAGQAVGERSKRASKQASSVLPRSASGPSCGAVSSKLRSDRTRAETEREERERERERSNLWEGHAVAELLRWRKRPLLARHWCRAAQAR